MSDETFGLGDVATAAAPAPLADAPAAPDDAPASAPADVAPLESASTAVSDSPATPMAPMPAAGPAAQPSAPAVPEWQQQLQYVQHIDTVLQMQEAVERQAAERQALQLQQLGATPEQVSSVLANYQAEAQARAEARLLLQNRRAQLELEAQRQALEGPSQEIVIHRLTEMVLQHAPSLSRKDVAAKLQRMPVGEAMIVRAQEMVEDARQAALTQRAHAGTDTMSVGHPAPAPANASPEDDIAAGLRLVYGQSRR